MKNCIYLRKWGTAFALFLFLSTLGLMAQNTVKVSGQVVDARSGEPLIGVSILERGTTNGVISDMDGRFTLQLGGGG